ncbi:Asp-tRNA(Asn)/Glu-tRNA(Gln) amidotransferase subunit GatC [Bdellovibrio bacteriovorus]|uniref:Aspartyl/glutamyl-tRNA(Asn/Gln) amidotransferase subunit C n=1 Tax=Bdellovibrio bacteriovorus (strain ATCC 15356 / DSM 50701 / NCIMB 9529 / HD100) TaxID=264462 RepID=Q6MRL8_BDEBA|nr:Asp-tRNA(Asn)/Glu-tRNA(Gln) amidotransferase subunit GatC [Bdellovibrio bacteriovorus]AHZ85715.1 glutamyl-tRNA amidotransferase [Bdellovibrio bacteriovorus]BEV66634.1 Glutamyl-tRNA(Gln) amidotransferase subunit C [Bdellovibrio bacteriovorus]CAE77739.1 glutamyl-tRNA(Gln) amidotransferase (subunit C) [Bdellovibrio bacteriovorus HD100]
MIDKKAIEHIAKLARLHITEDEAQEYSTQLAKALTHFEQISKINTAGIEPMVTPTEIEAYWREDVVKQDFTAEEMTGNAPDRAGNLFKVPPVV